MKSVERILRADDTRPTRLHDGNGKLHLEPEIVPAFLSTIRRHFFKQYPRLPWITYRAIRYIKPRIRDANVFEYGAGTSTLWFAENAKSVLSVENDPTWSSRVADQLSARANARLEHLSNELDFITSVDKHSPFDLYVVDCQSRAEYRRSTDALRSDCLLRTFEHANAGALFIIDNTDVYPTLAATCRKLFGERGTLNFSGWVPGILHPNQTTIAFKSGAPI